MPPRLAPVPATGAADDRGTAFTVDEHRGHVAWTEADSTDHRRDAGVRRVGGAPARAGPLRVLLDRKTRQGLRTLGGTQRCRAPAVHGRPRTRPRRRNTCPLPQPST
ncbi:hypothetical protein GCM10027168_57640 [Streptomyces capparidis]